MFFLLEVPQADCICHSVSGVVAAGAAIGACEKTSQWQWAIFLLSTQPSNTNLRPSCFEHNPYFCPKKQVVARCFCFVDNFCLFQLKKVTLCSIWCKHVQWVAVHHGFGEERWYFFPCSQSPTVEDHLLFSSHCLCQKRPMALGLADLPGSFRQGSGEPGELQCSHQCLWTRKWDLERLRFRGAVGIWWV